VSTAAAANTTIAIVFLALGLLVVGLCRASARADHSAEAHRPRVWDNTNGEWVHVPPGAQPGSGQLTVDEVTEADPLELLLEAPAYEGPRQPIHDEQTKGEL
jgi:hypothetical protein